MNEQQVRAEATAKSIVENYFSHRLAKANGQFLARFAELRMYGGGDADEPMARRRSSRLNPVPNQQELDINVTVRRRRRRAEVPKKGNDGGEEGEGEEEEKAEDGGPDAPKVNEPKKKAKNVRFTKKVEMQLYEMREASPRRGVGGRIRRRVELGEKLAVEAPKELRRLKRPRGHLRELPKLTTEQRKDILGPNARKLTPETEIEQLKDSGCRSTCSRTGCGDTCLCLLNKIVCYDGVCPCVEETCPNARDDQEFEDADLFKMRVDLANYDLMDQSSATENETIPSVDASSAFLYSFSAEDEDGGAEGEEEANAAVEMEAEGGEEAMAADEMEALEGEEANAADEMEALEGEEAQAADEMEAEEGEEAQAADEMEAEEGEEAGTDDTRNDSRAKNVRSLVGAVPDVEEEAEDVEEEVEESDTSSNDSRDAHVQAFAGVLPDFGIDLAPENFSPSVLKQMPMALDANARDSCLGNRWLDGEAVHIGLLKESTRFNVANVDTGRRCATLHPAVFSAAMRLAEADEVEKQRRKAAKIRGAADPSILDPDEVAQSVVYGNQWTEMLIPMHLFGNHWAVAVVMRSKVSAVIFDSSQHLKDRTKAETDLIKAALRKVLIAVQKTNIEDKTTGRYKIRLTQRGHREEQKDYDNCGIFSIVHSRRVLERGNANASTRKDKGDADIDIKAERRALRTTMIELFEFYEYLKDEELEMRHGPAGFSGCVPAKVGIALVCPASSRC